MNKETVRVLVTSPLGVGGVTNMMIHIQEHLDRSKINFDYLVFHDRHEPMEDQVAINATLNQWNVVAILLFTIAGMQMT